MRIEYLGIEGSGEIYLDVLKVICGETSGKSMVDLGCYHAPYTPQLGFSERWYVDVQDRPLDFKEEQQYFIQEGVLDFLISCQRTHSVMIASDFVEHLSYFDGGQLMALMEQKSKKQIVFTPLGSQGITNDDHPDSHKSGWNPDDFTGWASIIFPNFHPSLDCGAFFTFHCDNLTEEFNRVKTELNTKSWAK